MDKVSLEIKTHIMALAREKLQLQLEDIQKQLADLKSSSQGEGKSSAGDKYETQREMIKQSADILDRQLLRVLLMINQLENVPCQVSTHVQEGALVKIPIGWVWVSVSLGEVVHQEQKYQLISKDSPLFVAIKGLKAGQSTVFRSRKLSVEEVM